MYLLLFFFLQIIFRVCVRVGVCVSLFFAQFLLLLKISCAHCCELPLFFCWVFNFHVQFFFSPFSCFSSFLFQPTSMTITTHLKALAAQVNVCTCCYVQQQQKNNLKPQSLHLEYTYRKKNNNNNKKATHNSFNLMPINIGKKGRNTNEIHHIENTKIAGAKNWPISEKNIHTHTHT